MTRTFYEDETEAVRAMIADSGKSIKECALHLWGASMKPEVATAKLRAQLNHHNEGEQLKFADVLALMKYCDAYDPLYYLCDNTSHGTPPRLSTQDQEVELAETLKQAADTLARTMARLDRLQADRAAHPEPIDIRRAR